MQLIIQILRRAEYSKLTPFGAHRLAIGSGVLTNLLSKFPTATWFKAHRRIYFIQPSVQAPRAGIQKQSNLERASEFDLEFIMQR